jgi:hypothetical protein
MIHSQHHITGKCNSYYSVGRIHRYFVSLILDPFKKQLIHTNGVEENAKITLMNSHMMANMSKNMWQSRQSCIARFIAAMSSVHAAMATNDVTT